MWGEARAAGSSRQTPSSTPGSSSRQQTPGEQFSCQLQQLTNSKCSGEEHDLVTLPPSIPQAFPLVEESGGAHANQYRAILVIDTVAKVNSLSGLGSMETL